MGAVSRQHARQLEKSSAALHCSPTHSPSMDKPVSHSLFATELLPFLPAHSLSKIQQCRSPSTPAFFSPVNQHPPIGIQVFAKPTPSLFGPVVQSYNLSQQKFIRALSGNVKSFHDRSPSEVLRQESFRRLSNCSKSHIRSPSVYHATMLSPVMTEVLLNTVQ